MAAPRRLSIAVLASSICGVAIPAASSSAPRGDYTVTFLARPVTASGYGGPSPVGHAYIILGVRTSSGIKEDAYGFYPGADGKGKIRGPGMLKSEWRCMPSEPCGERDFARKLGASADTVKTASIELSLDQYRSVHRIISKWNSAGYDLINSNCNSFLADVLKAAGYEPPARSLLNMLPQHYIASVADAIQAQDALRREKARADNADAARRQAESELERARTERDKAAAERDRALADAQAAKRAKAEADRVPAGWIQCTCPDQHSLHGKVVAGVRWHAKSIGLCR